MSTLVWMLVAVLLLTNTFTRFKILSFMWHEALRLLVLLDLGALRLVQKIYPPRYRVLGSCQRRGFCCKRIVGNPPRFIKRSRLLDLFAAYHRVFHNFHVVARGPENELIFSCGHLKTDGRCGIYRYRPLLCRNFPLLPWFEPPRILPGCGYRVAAAAVARMRPRPSLPIINPQVAVHHPSPASLDTPQGWLDAPTGAATPNSLTGGRKTSTTFLGGGDESASDYEMFDP